MVRSLEVRFSVSGTQIPSSYSSCSTVRSGKHNYIELGTNGGWSGKLADNFGLDRRVTNELFELLNRAVTWWKQCLKRINVVKEEESEGKNTMGMDTNAKAVVMIGRKWQSTG